MNLLYAGQHKNSLNAHGGKLNYPEYANSVVENTLSKYAKGGMYQEGGEFEEDIEEAEVIGSTRLDDLEESLMDVGTVALNVAPNFRNIREYSGLPGIRTPRLQRAITTKAPSLESAKQSVLAQGRNLSNQARFDSRQASTATRAQALAKTQQAISDLAGQESLLKARVDQSNAAIQNRINAANIAAMNRYYGDVTERELAITRGQARERGAIARKALGFIGDTRRRKLDKERMDLTRQEFNLQGQMSRAEKAFFDEHGYLPSFATE